MDDAVAGLGADPDRPLRPGLRFLRSLSDRVWILARAAARNLRPLVRGSDLRALGREHAGVPDRCDQSQDDDRAVVVGIFRSGANLDQMAVGAVHPAVGGPVDPDDHVEAASVDGATRFQKFRFVTWPSMQTLYVTCTILSMIWTLGDFNSVYLLTGGGPGDLTHVLATLGIRYLRLDAVNLSMATIVCALPLVLPLVYVMMRRLSR